MSDSGNNKITDPVIVEREPFIAVGLEYAGPMDNFEAISALWGSYIRRSREIQPKAQKNIGFGVFYTMPEQAEIGETTYLACAAVKEDTEVPEGMERMDVPGGTYAQMTHRGIMTDLPETFSQLFTWLEDSPYTPLNAPGYEYYDERFNASSPECEIDIFIPVKSG